MTLSKQLKDLRKINGMSQETLAEKLGVSRQAVTKWETDGGMPDIDNLIRISNLFGITVDQLLSNEIENSNSKGYPYESKTEYDLDEVKHFDIKLGGLHTLYLIGTEGEKVKVGLGSNDIETIQENFKVKIDDTKNRLDIDIKRKHFITQAQAKECLVVTIEIPTQYLDDIEIETQCNQIYVNSIVCENMELKGKIKNVSIENMQGKLELDCNLDMEISLDRFQGSFEINAISSTSRLIVPSAFSFRSKIKGLSNSISYACNKEKVEDFSDSGAENIIELNGFKSELVIEKKG